jgi:hypothetical protein
MTYAEIASRLGVSGEAARQLVRRRGWHRIVPNRPGATTIIIVPADELTGMDRRDTRTADIGDTRTADGVAAFETALTAIEAAHAAEVAALRGQVDMSEQARLAAEQQLRGALELADRSMAQLAHASERIEQAEGRADTAQQRADRAEYRADELRGRIDELEVNLGAARAEAQQATEAAATLAREEVARQARGRLRRAWDGWRGR